MQITPNRRLMPRWRTSRVCRLAKVVTLALTVCLLAACGVDPQPESSNAHENSKPVATVTPPALTDLQAAAREVLAERLSVSADTLALVSDQEVQWSDASLGCPEEGMMYAQVITPGHRITFSYDGKHYEVHTSMGDDSGPPSNMVSCEGGTSY